MTATDYLYTVIEQSFPKRTTVYFDNSLYKLPAIISDLFMQINIVITILILEHNFEHNW